MDKGTHAWSHLDTRIPIKPWPLSRHNLSRSKRIPLGFGFTHIELPFLRETDRHHDRLFILEYCPKESLYRIW